MLCCFIVNETTFYYKTAELFLDTKFSRNLVWYQLFICRDLREQRDTTFWGIFQQFLKFQNRTDTYKPRRNTKYILIRNNYIVNCYTMEQLTSVYERIGEAIGESLESVCSMREEERRELIITLGLEDTVNRIEDRVSRKVKDDPDQGKLTVIQRIAAAIGETVENVTKLPGAEIGQLVRVLGLEDLAAQEDEEHVDSGGSGGGSAVIDVADLSTDDRFFNT